MKKAELFESIGLDENKNVKCKACAQECIISPEKLGLCGVRKNQEGVLYSLTYGRLVAQHIDPIEKKPLFNFPPPEQKVYSIGTVGCNFACEWCFHPDTRVLTDKGCLKIKDVHNSFNKNNEKFNLITHKGNLKKLRNVFERPVQEKLLKIKPHYCPEILCTKEHNLYVNDKGKIKKQKAKNLKKGDYLLIPKIKDKGRYQKHIDIGKLFEGISIKGKIPIRKTIPKLDEILRLKKNNFSSREIANRFNMHPTYIRKVLSKLKKGWTPKTNYEIMLVEKGEHIKFKGEKGAGIKKHMKISKDLARLLGFFCAEGHITQHSKRPNSYTVEFSFGKHEKEQIKEVFDLFYRIFGIELTKRERRSVIALTSVSSSIGMLFNKLCGQGAKNKKVPFFLFNSSKEIIKEFLNAYDTGDGWGGRGEHPISMNTVSKDLALDIFYLFLKLNYLPCFYVWNPPRKKNIEGREVNQSTLYYIKLYAEEFRRRFHDKSYEGIVSKKSKDNLRFKEDSDYFYVPIKETKDHPYNGHVYNLEIEDDHSYLANFVSAGNCQNWDISQIEKEAQIMGKEVNPEEVVEEALNMECEGIAYTYNEPAINIEFVRDTARIAKKKGLKNVLVTNGYFTKKSFDYLNKDKLIDAMNIDLKAFKDETYKKHCNAIHGIQPVLDTIKRAHNAGIHLELTTLVIPDLNDSEEELKEIAKFIFSLDQGRGNVPWHISRFFPMFKFADGKRRPTSVKKLKRAKEIGEKVGLKKIYLGNI